MNELPSIDFDGNWKESISEFFEDAMAFFLPKLYPLIDFSHPPEFLEQELHSILEAIDPDKKVADKLAKVRLKDGTVKWILIHIEVQSYFEKLFTERMFLMFSSIFARYRERIVALVIYTGVKVPLQFDRFEQKQFGTHMLYRFNTYRVMKQSIPTLQRSRNIFALFVLANKYVNETRDDLQYRLQLKEQIFEIAFSRDFDLQKINRFVIFVHNIMLLPLDLDRDFHHYLNLKLKKMQAVKDRPLMKQGAKELIDTYAEIVYGERIDTLLEKTKNEGMEKGMEKGVEKGIEIGIFQGQELEREKERQRNRQTVLKLFREMAWSAEKIADVLVCPIEEVNQILATPK